MATYTAPPKQVVTDEQLAERLEHVENGLRHLEHWVPSLLREVAEIRQLLASGALDRTERVPELETTP
jgi:hypothetical protein